MSFFFRKARVEDAERMFELDRVCFPPDFHFAQKAFHLLLKRRGTISLVVQTPEKPLAGFIIAEPAGPLATCIATIDVHPDEQRNGLGTRLLKKAVEEAAKRHLFQSFLQVYVDNLGAIEFYMAMGYDVIDTLPSFYGPQKDGLLMFRNYQQKKATRREIRHPYGHPREF